MVRIPSEGKKEINWKDVLYSAQARLWPPIL